MMSDQDDPKTTLSLGEEDPPVTTLSLGEEDKPRPEAMPSDPTTMATGEEGGGGPTTMATGEETTAVASGSGNPFGSF
jgi:hypothetical protein